MTRMYMWRLAKEMKDTLEKEEYRNGDGMSVQHGAQKGRERIKKTEVKESRSYSSAIYYRLNRYRPCIGQTRGKRDVIMLVNNKSICNPKYLLKLWAKLYMNACYSIFVPYL